MAFVVIGMGISSHTSSRKLDVPVEGMDCASCARHVRDSLAQLPGVRTVDVLLAAGRAVLEVDENEEPDAAAIRAAVEGAGYRVGSDFGSNHEPRGVDREAHLSGRLVLVFGLVLGMVLFVAVGGEWLGLIDRLNEAVPFWVGFLIAALIGYPVAWTVLRSALRGRVVAHALMVVGAAAALLVGEWVTASVVLFFTRVGAHVEQLTAAKARTAVERLSALAPRLAVVVRDGEEVPTPASAIEEGDVVLVRPGEKVPVDGTVFSGRADVDLSAITGESIPVSAEPGTTVYAAGIVSGGALRIVAHGPVGESVFGRALRLVEEAEANRGPVQRVADRFSAYYLPIVASIAVLTYVIGGALMPAIAVMVVACACAFALATPVALLASIGTLARRGVLVKGGLYLEALDRTDVVVVDKTGTLTIGAPAIVEVSAVDGRSEDEILELAAGAELYSEHPLGRAIVDRARAGGLSVPDPDDFMTVPGMGVEARIRGHAVRVGRRGWTAFSDEEAGAARGTGRTTVYVSYDGRVIGVLTASDVLRPDVPEAIRLLRQRYGVEVLLLTGDGEDAASVLAGQLDIRYQANLLPEEKIEIVRDLQHRGKRVVMIGDGVNDAPALAQADVGIAMGAIGTEAAIEAAHVVLMRDDWRTIPLLFEDARRTMRVVRMNIGFTALYNAVGIALAAAGILAPVLAAALQSIPDVGIMANSARLIRR